MSDTQASTTQPIAPELRQALRDPLGSIQQTLLQIWADFLAHLPLLLGGLAICLATWGVATLGQRLAANLLRRTRLRRSLQELFRQCVFLMIWVIGLLLAAMVVFPGLTPTKALGGLGLLSIAVGFAFKDIFENFFAGVLLLWRFPFEPDDYIECEEILGRVERITVRMTTIRLPTDERVVVPNSYLLKNPVRILSTRGRRRTGIVVGVTYGADLPEAQETIESALADCPTVSEEHRVEVFAQCFNSSSIDFEVCWWADATPLGERRSRSEVIIAIKRAFDARGLEIPFPQRTLTFDAPLEVERKRVT